MGLGANFQGGIAGMQHAVRDGDILTHTIPARHGAGGFYHNGVITR